jgi:tetracycline repressor-like protein
MFKTAAPTANQAQAGVTERKILDAALDLFRTKGLAEITMRDVMGVVYFWVTDDSAGQQRTARLVNLGAKIVAILAAPLLARPVRKVIVGLIETETA